MCVLVGFPASPRQQCVVEGCICRQQHLGPGQGGRQASLGWERVSGLGLWLRDHSESHSDWLTDTLLCVGCKLCVCAGNVTEANKRQSKRGVQWGRCGTGIPVRRNILLG